MTQTNYTAKIAFATAISLLSTFLFAKQALTSTSNRKIQKATVSQKNAVHVARRITGKALKKFRTPPTYKTSEHLRLNAKDTVCLTRNVYHEARGESYAGKLAVAQVTLNRLESHQWGSSVCKVVYAPAQFSWTADPGKRYKVPSNADWMLSQRIVHDYTQGLRVAQLGDAQYFHAKRLGRPHWTKKLQKSADIGNHVFYK